MPCHCGTAGIERLCVLAYHEGTTIVQVTVSRRHIANRDVHGLCDVHV